VRRICLTLVAALSIAAFCCPAALGANYDVAAKSSPNAFAPSSITITQGDTVTWSNTGGTHNVKFDDGSFEMPPDPISDAWSVPRKFDVPGTYRFYCEAHGDVGGVGMSGVVTVNSLPPAGGGGGGGGPGPTPGPTVDAAPVSSLTSPSKQDVDKLFVRASMNEAGTLAATGTVSVPRGAAKTYRFKRASKTVSANQTIKLRLKLSRKALKTVRRALRHRGKLSAKITLTARDLTGRETTRKQTIRLTR
jgi:plastocyanin